MKRIRLTDRVKLLADKRGELLIASRVATEAHDSGITWKIRDASTSLELAALEYAKAQIRYLGGAW